MKNIFLGMLILICIQITFRELTDSRSVIFEKYNEKEFRTEMTKRYLGRDVDIVIEELIASGVERMNRLDINKSMPSQVKKHAGYQENVAYVYSFKYFSPLLSLNSLSKYVIYLETDKNRSVVDICGYKESFFQYFWW